VTSIETHAKLVEQWLTPPDDGPLWKWAEGNIDLTGLSALEGPYRTDVSPMVRWLFNALQDRETRRLVVMVSAQAGKTQTLMIFAAWAICEAPGPMFWVGASEEACDEFTKARLLPMFEQTPAVAKRMPLQRSEKSLNLIQFATMPLYFRGSNSPSKLKSTPVRYFIGDEIDDWKPGSLDKVLKRVRTYRNSKQVLISTPELSGGSMHTHFLSGTQTFFHWACPHCQHRQPFRFGRERTVLFEPRDKGGFIWDTNDTTRPAGKWNWQELRKTVRYQCESCEGEIYQVEQFKLLQTIEAVDRNPLPENGVKSWHFWAAYSLWVKWDDIVVEFLTAKEVAETGNIEMLKSFVKETLGEPWALVEDAANEDELRKRCGQYKRGEYWEANGPRRVSRIITVDVQKDHLRYVISNIREGGELRVVDYGRLTDFADLRALQEQKGVANRGVFIDCADGNRSTEILRECMRWNWIAMQGSAQDSFAHLLTSNGKTVQRPFKVKQIDPFIGTNKGATRTVTRISWSNNAFKDRLFLFAYKGKGPLFELPSDVGSDFLTELLDERREAKKSERGATRYVWKDTGNNHFSDCLLMAYVAMDATAFSRGVFNTEAKEYELKESSQS